VGCGEEVAYEDIAKGYDSGGGEMVMLTDDDFAGLPLASTHAIDVLEFVPADQIDPVLYANAYFLEPDGAAIKPYVLLREALVRTNQIAIVKVALRHREQLATLRVRANVLVLNTMLWPDEVRQVDFGFLDEDIETRPAELAMASSLIDSMAGSFKPEEFTDNYRAALQEVIDAKVEGREVVAPEETEEAPSAAVDLMAALKASVERAKAARGESPEARARAVEATPIKSTAAKKASTAASKKAAPASKKATPAASKKATPAASKKATPAAKKAAKKSA